MVALERELLERLKPITDDFAFEVRVILETVFGKDYRLKSLAGRLSEPTQEQCDRIQNMLSRRLSGEPLQYIVGEWEFCGLTFKVGRGVLIPRQDTETLVEMALRFIENIPSPQVLDLCSGTGCVAAAIKHSRPDAKVYAIERYTEAFEILCENCRRFGGIEAIQADALDHGTAGSFKELDVITANPPYLTKKDIQSLQREVEYEPMTALFGGDDGLDFYRVLSKVWHGSLRDGGGIFYEIGLGQQDSVSEILSTSGYRDIRFAKDLTDRIRVVSAIK